MGDRALVGVGYFCLSLNSPFFLSDQQDIVEEVEIDVLLVVVPQFTQGLVFTAVRLDVR